MIKKLAVCIILSQLATNCSAEISTQNDELDQVRSDIDAVKNKMQLILQQKNDLNDQLAEIENQYGETASLLRTLRKKVEKKRENINEIHLKINENRDQIEKYGKELAGQIKAAYAMGQQEKLKLLLNQQDPALSSRMMVYYGYFNKTRLKKMAELEAYIAQLDQLNQQQNNETEILESDLRKKKLEQAALDNLKLKRNKLLEQLANDFSSNEQRLNRLIESENKLKNLIDALQDKDENSLGSEIEQSETFSEPEEATGLAENSSNTSGSSADNELYRVDIDFPALKGKLPWPVKGKLAKHDSNVGVEAIRDGVLIDAGEGTEIHAVTKGKVVYSEWLRGYGLLMIIDHGKGYMTLYAFNQSLYKRAGDWVQAGDVIASVGQSGGRAHSGLYFGIRKNGKPVDPLEWCPKPDRDRTG